MVDFLEFAAGIPVWILPTRSFVVAMIAWILDATVVGMMIHPVALGHSVAVVILLGAVAAFVFYRKMSVLSSEFLRKMLSTDDSSAKQNYEEIPNLSSASDGRLGRLSTGLLDFAV